MKTELLFEFSVNKEDKTIHVTREFDADLPLVWRTWTEADLLDKWWAPQPYHVETKTLDFREGGLWLYAMVSPKDEKQWCKADYKAIEQLKSISWLDAFCDEEGNDTPGKPKSFWTNIFTAGNGLTTVEITLEHEKLSDIEAMIDMGFKEGFTMGLQNLDDLLATLKENK